MLYGTAQSLSAGVQWMRDTWHAQGDLWALMRPGWQPGQPYRVPSLLRGDGEDGFHGRVVSELEKHLGASVPELVSPHISIDLAATLEAGPPVRRQTKQAARDPEAHFHFRKYPRRQEVDGPRPHPQETPEDFPLSSDDRHALHRLAYAARTTSSFPGAFEPASFYSTPPHLVSDAPAGETTRLNLHGVFSETTGLSVDNQSLAEEATGEPASMSVFDGGVFDNIPIVRALDAISDMPADTAVDRRLFYLDPDPPDLEQPPGVGEAPRPGDLSTFFLATTTRALSMKQRRESADDDIAVLRRAVQQSDLAVRRRKVVFDGVAAGIALTPAGDADGEEPLSSYARWRAHEDAERLTELVLRPGLVTLRSLVGPALTDVVIDETASLDLRFWLRGHLSERYRVSVPVITSDARSLYLLCGHLITASQQLEREAGTRTPETSSNKQRLQLLRAIAEKFAAADDRSAFVHDKGGVFRGEVMAKEYCASIAAEGSAAPLPDWDSLTQDEPAFWDVLRAEPADSFPTHRDALWKLAAELARPLEPAFPGVGLAAGGTAPVIRLNAYLCNVLGRPNLLGLLKFQAITGDEQPLDGHRSYPEVKKGARTTRVSALLKVPSRQFTAERFRWQFGRPELSARTKLAGNQLGNFAGFLDADWRDHDFEWGRRDAASAIASAFRTKKLARDPGYEKGNFWELPDLTWTDESPGGPARLDQSRVGLGDLPSRRRFALVSRGLQLLQRAVWPLTLGSSDSGSKRVFMSIGGLNVRQVVISVLLLLLRIPLAVLPLFIAPVRLVPVVVIGLLVARLTVPDLQLTTLDATPGSDPSWVALSVLAGAVALLLSRCYRLAQRWRKVRELDTENRLGAWPRNGFRLSVVAVVGLLTVLVLVAVGRLGVPGPEALVSGWEGSTAFERAVLVGAVVACGWVLPTMLRTPLDKLRAQDVAKVLALEIALGALTLLPLAAPDDASTALDSLSIGTPALVVQAGLAAILVIAVVARWTQLGWLLSAALVTVVAVLLADPVIQELGERGFPRAAMLLAAGAGLGLLIALLQLGGVGLRSLVARAAARPWALDALGLLGMLVGACLAAVVGQLVFQPFGQLGVPLGLWQGMFCAALVTIFVQPDARLGSTSTTVA